MWHNLHIVSWTAEFIGTEAGTLLESVGAATYLVLAIKRVHKKAHTKVGPRWTVCAKQPLRQHVIQVL
jgi:hypothetical protein